MKVVDTCRVIVAEKPAAVVEGVALMNFPAHEVEAVQAPVHAQPESFFARKTAP